MGRWALPSCHPLREARTSRKLTLEKFANRCRPYVCKSDISRYERGEKHPGPAQLLGMSRGLGLTLAEVTAWFPEADVPLLRFAGAEVSAVERLLVYAEATGALPESAQVLRSSLDRQLGGAA